MRRAGLLAVPAIAVALLLTSCAPAQPALPTEWPELEAIEGVLEVGVLDGTTVDPPRIRVQLDDRAEPADIVRAALEVRDTAADLAPLADGFDLALYLVRPGDFPASSVAWWRDGTQSDDEFEQIVATLAAFGLPEPTTKVFVTVSDYDGEGYDDWLIESYATLDTAAGRALEAALTTVAAEQGLEPSHVRIARGFPGQ